MMGLGRKSVYSLIYEADLVCDLNQTHTVSKAQTLDLHIQ